MKRRHLLWLGALALIPLAFVRADSPEDKQPELFQRTEPFKSGYLRVSERHEIFYGLFGNPDGKPVIVLHGGPGFGCYPRLAQYFNPEKYLIILHDQRGAGRSRPAGELRENTTQDLVEDIERLREHLKIDGKALIFGGSWGSTLALAYAEAHPDHVSGLILRGVFTATQNEIIEGFQAKQAQRFFPDAWAELEKTLPPPCKTLEPSEMLKVFSGKDEKKAREVAAAWIRFAVKIDKMHASDEEVEEGFGDWNPLPGARIDCHYASNAYFLEEGQLLRDADRLKGIPAIIINGRYDMICPPITASRIHKAMPKSKLVIVEEAGHSEAEPGTTAALLNATRHFE